MAELEFLRYEVQGTTGIITLNRPERMNALHPAMTRSIFQVVQELRSAPTYDVRALIVTGEGRSFCSGGEVTRFGPSTEPIVWRPPQGDRNSLTWFQSLDIPVICAVNGYAIGAGLGLALAGDVAIASDQAKFALYQPKRGVNIDGGSSWAVTRRIGPQRALHLAFSTQMIDAEEALKLGLVLEVVPHDQLMDRAIQVAESYAMAAPIALAITKRAVYNALNWTASQSVEYEAWGVYRSFASEDVKEGVKAFQEKREPIFRGR